MLNQHYLSTMFTLDSDEECMDTNDFMETLVDEMEVRGGQNVPDFDTKSPMGFQEGSAFVTSLTSGPPASGNKKRISELSRLWEYRNGEVPTL